MIRRSGLLAALLMAAVSPHAAGAQWGQGGKINIYVMPPEFQPEYLGINNSGQMAGYAFLTASYTPYASRATPVAGGTFSITTLSSSQSHGYAINNAGEVAGVQYYGNQGNSFGALFSTGATQDLGNGAVASAVNDLGHAAGYTTIPQQNAAIAVNGTMTPFSTALSSSAALGINNSDVVVGFGYDATGHYHAAMSRNGVFVDVGVPSWASSSELRSISNAGLAAGEGDLGSIEQAELYDTNADTWIDLGMGYDASTAWDVSDFGTVVGHGFNATTGDQDAIIWSRTASGHVASSLDALVNDPDLHFFDAGGISDDGQWIAAYEYDSATDTYSTVALEAMSGDAPAVTTAPEPASLALIAPGLLGIVVVVRHRKKHRAS